MFFNAIPEISAKQLSTKFTSAEDLIVLDVRETWEIETAKIDNPKVLNLPMSILGKQQLAALPETITQDKQAQIVVMCHHGSRSASVAMWLIRNGWKNVTSLAGGIDAYAAEIDNTIGFY